MSFLNHNIPVWKAKVRLEYLYNKEKHIGEEEVCLIHSITTLEGRTPLFNIMLPNGANYARLPITAFFSDQYNRKDVVDLELKQTVYWDCLSYHANVIEYNALATSQCKFIDRNNKLHRANYIFSIDYAQPDMNLLNITYSEVSEEHKHHHILELNNLDEWQGNYALMPNNKILFNLPNFTVKDQIPDYKTNMDYPSVETDSWSTSDDDSFYYKVKN
jgi:hypothetical protein